MSDPKVWRAFGRTLISPPAVMIVTAVFGIGLTADRRVDIGAIASVRYEPSLSTPVKLARLKAHRRAHRKGIGPSDARAEEPLVLAALPQPSSLIDLPLRYAPLRKVIKAASKPDQPSAVAADAGVSADTASPSEEAFVGPPEPARLAMTGYQPAEIMGLCMQPEASVRTAAAHDAMRRPTTEVVVAALAVVKEESGSGPIRQHGGTASAGPVSSAAADEVASETTGAATSEAAGKKVASEAAGPQIPEHLLLARLAAAGPQIPEHLLLARLAVAGPQIPEPLLLARLTAAAQQAQAADQAATPKRAVVLAKPQRLAHLDADFVGPPLPEGYHSRHKAPAQSSLLAMLASYDDDAFVGPIRPRELLPAAREHEHALPFDPLGERAFATATAKPEQAPSALEELMGGDDDLQTVRYIRDVKHRIRPGETFSEVLGTAGLSPREVDSWLSATKPYYNVDRVYAGQEMELVLDMPEKQLKRMKLEVGRDSVVVVEETVDGVVARREDIQYERRLRVVGGVIDHSLYVAAVEKGIPDRVISDIAEILGWEINFGRDLRPGDMFRVIYEELTRVDTMQLHAGRVLAVEIVSRGQSREAFYYQTANGADSGYYNRKGEGLGRAFLRYPVEFSRISSHFSNGRFHPVLKRRIPHYGVDFAAATGTPVKAVADGTVLQAGWFRGNGRFVKLRHDSVYESGYAHLSRIPAKIKAGTKVSKGEIIGYVGSTGLATGPHLHFALYRRGKYIDPLKADLPRARSLEGRELAGFRMKIDMMERAYAEGGEGTERSTQVAALPPEERDDLSK